MTDHGTLFKGEMIRALIEGRKTQTRRLATNRNARRWKDGDRLWVKETHALTQFGKAVYRADARDQDGDRWSSIQPDDPDGEVKWTPSILMPRVLSRITLPAIRVRVEPLWDITPEDAIAEGCPDIDAAEDPIGWYADLWDAINPKDKDFSFSSSLV